MARTKINTPELLDFPNDSISNKNNIGTIIPLGYTNLCKFPNNNTLLLYEFENNTNDSCGNYNATTTNAITYGTGKIGDAAEFDGSSSYIEYANFGGVLNTANAFSYSFWVYFNSIGIYDWVIGLQQAGSPYAGVGIFGGSSNNLGIAVAGAAPAVMTGTLSLSTWIHIAFTHDGNGNYKCYTDGGTPITYSGVTSSLSSNPLRLGYSSVSGWNYLDGDLDQVRIYNTQLSSQEVTELYNEGTTTPRVRPTTNLSTGEFRYNKTINRIEYYNVSDSSWYQIANSDLSGQPSTCECSFPNGNQPAILYQFEDNVENSCGELFTNGQATSITYSGGKFGNAAVFNGSAYINTGYYLANAKDFSFSIWANVTDNSANRYIAGDFNSGGADVSARFGLKINSSDQLYVFINNGGTAETGNLYDYSSHLGVWTHIVVTVTSNLVTVYVNGSSVATMSITNGLAGGQEPLTLGAYTDATSSQNYTGSMDQLRLYQTVLTAADVLDLYNEVACS